jgi:hypothetical protein
MMSSEISKPPQVLAFPTNAFPNAPLVPNIVQYSDMSMLEALPTGLLHTR